MIATLRMAITPDMVEAARLVEERRRVDWEAERLAGRAAHVTRDDLAGNKVTDLEHNLDQSYVAEQVFHKLFPQLTYRHDRATKSDFFDPVTGITFDVKKTGMRTAQHPQLDYAHALLHNPRLSGADYFAFVRVLDDLSRAWFCGFMLREDFIKRCRVRHAGDWSDNGNFQYHADAWEIIYEWAIHPTCNHTADPEIIAWRNRNPQTTCARCFFERGYVAVEADATPESAAPPPPKQTTLF